MNETNQETNEDTHEEAEQELGTALTPDAGRTPDNKITWPRVSIIIITLVALTIVILLFIYKSNR